MPGKKHRAQIAFVAFLFLPLLGCQRFEARVEHNRGNASFKQELYRDALQHFQRGLELDPTTTFAWRSVGLTAMVLYRPGVEEPENRKLAEIAIDAFQRYLKAFEGSKELDPKTEDYLLQTTLNLGRYDDALAFLEGRRAVRPGDEQIVPAMVGVLVKAGRLEEAVTLADQSTVPEQKAQQLHLIGVTAYQKSKNDAELGFERRAALIELGIGALERSNQIVADNPDVLTFWQLLLRDKAKGELSYEKQAVLYQQAEEIYERALGLLAKDQSRGKGL